MHPDLEKMRVRDVPWSTMNPVHKGPRWVVVAVDNVATGWSDIRGEPAIEGYFSTYIFDSWRVYHYCSPQKTFHLYGVSNTAWVKDGTDEFKRDEIYEEWEVGVGVDSTMVDVDEMERQGSPWVVLQVYNDDGECGDDDERKYTKYVEGFIEGLASCPPLLAPTAKAARVHDPAWLLRHHGAKEKQREDQETDQEGGLPPARGVRVHPGQEAAALLQPSAKIPRGRGSVHRDGRQLSLGGRGPRCRESCEGAD